MVLDVGTCEVAGVSGLGWRVSLGRVLAVTTGGGTADGEITLAECSARTVSLESL